MLIRVLLATSTKNKQPGINIIYELLNSFNKNYDTLHDIMYDTSKQKKYELSDVIVIFGTYFLNGFPPTKKRGLRHDITDIYIRTHQLQLNKQSIIIELPLLGRTFATSHLYWRVGINGWLNNQGYYNNKDMSNDRWLQIKQDCNINLKPFRQTGVNIIIALQKPSDASLLGIDMSKWCCKMIKHIRKYTKRRIIIRPHTLAKTYDNVLINKYVNKYKNIEYIPANQYPKKRNDFINAWCVVSFTSGYSVDSIINGIPVFAMSKHNFTYDLGNIHLSNIENPIINDEERMQFLYNLSYCQWTKNEIELGLPWKHLFNE
jgi:hypothetical protein